jgi:hypothetical protein
MKVIVVLSWARRHVAVIALVIGSFLIDTASAQTFSVASPVRVSGPGEIVAEFSSATAPNDSQLMAASAIKRLSPSQTLCGVYVSRNGGNVWSEVPAWPDGGLQALYDPWVAIGPNGTIHATGVARTNIGSRVAYTQSRDQGVILVGCTPGNTFGVQVPPAKFGQRLPYSRR